MINPRRHHRTCPRTVKRARYNSYRVKNPATAHPPPRATDDHSPSEPHDQSRLRGSTPETSYVTSIIQTGPSARVLVLGDERGEFVGSFVGQWRQFGV
jgi:hypothetical protein